MILDHDCVRDVLLFLESALSYNSDGVLDKEITFFDFTIASCLEKYQPAVILYTIQKLTEAEYINPRESILDNEYYFIFDGVRGITYEGHRFLDNIRSESVWSKTKNKVKKNVGSASLQIISAVASDIVKHYLGLK